MRVSRRHLDYVTFRIYEELKGNSRVKILNPDLLVATVRTSIQENLRVEEELEREAEQMLKAHRTEILREGADYRRMVREGMKTLARKRGIPL